MDFKDYYKAMGVARDATQDDIKRAYRRLARKYHPDVSKAADAEVRFKELGEAYEVLKDPEKRAAYDQLGQNWQAGQEFRPPPDWGTGFEFTDDSGDAESAARFSEFFESLFGHGQGFTAGVHTHQRRARGRGEDHHSRIEISPYDAFHGATLGLQLQIPEYDAQGYLKNRLRKLQVRIPRGVTSGKRIRLAGQGGAGSNGGPAGDLYLEVRLKPDRLYQVEGKDVFVNLPLAPWEAALGGKVQVPTLAGKVDLNIPAGARTGQKLRLKGRGLPVAGEAAGDQIVVLQIMTPPADSAEKRALYEKMARELPFNPRLQMGG